MDAEEIRDWVRSCEGATNAYVTVLERMIYRVSPEEMEEAEQAIARISDGPEIFVVPDRRDARVFSMVEVRPQDVEIMLSEIGVKATSLVMLETFAIACTLGAALLRIDREAGPPSKPIEREGNNALATLRRVLPEIIDSAEFFKDARATDYRELLASVRKVQNFTCPEPSTTWHSIAQVLTGLYKLFIDMGAEELPRGGGIRFTQVVLSKLGFNCTRGAIEKALARRAGRDPEPFPPLPKENSSTESANP